MTRFPAHPFPPRGSDVLQEFDFADLAAIGFRLPHPYVLDVLDEDASDACARAAAALSHRLPSAAEDLAIAAAAVNACTARSTLGSGPEWRWIERKAEVGIYRWTTLPAAWGIDLLSQRLAPMMQGRGSLSPAGKAIDRLDELQRTILAGRNWWPAWDRALRAMAGVPVIWKVHDLPIDLAPPMSPAPSQRPPVWPHSIEATA